MRAQAAAQREAERAWAAYQRAQAADEKERKRLYAESRAAAVAAKNDDLEVEIAALQGLLAATLKVNDQISFSSLKKPAAVPPWRHADLERPEPPPGPDAFKPAPPTGLSKMFGKGKYCPAGKDCQDLGTLSRTLANSRDYDALLDAWQGWRTISPPMRRPRVHCV